MKRDKKIKSLYLIIITFILIWQNIITIIVDGDENSIEQDVFLMVENKIIDFIQKVNEETLKKYVQRIQDFGPHPTGSKACEDVGNYICNELKGMGLTVKCENWSLRGKSGRNIEAILSGESDGSIIICAHYDSVFISPGADDDGSGVAAILTIANIINHYEFNSTIKFVLFSGEEQGRLGSREYVKNAYKNMENIIGVINLDGIGYAATARDGSIIKILVDDDSSWLVDISEEVNRRYGEYIDLDIIHLPNEPISDHQSFLDYGYNAIYFLEYTLDPYYHTSEDKIEYMNFTYLKKVTRLSLGTLLYTANSRQIIADDDIKIEVKGTILSYPLQMYIRIENLKYKEDTANLTIGIEMINIFTNEYVKGPYNTTCNWVFSKEINKYWEFKVASRSYSLQFFIMHIIVNGFNDEVGLHKEEETFGFTFSTFIIIIPLLDQ